MDYNLQNILSHCEKFSEAEKVRFILELGKGLNLETKLFVIISLTKPIREKDETDNDEYDYLKYVHKKSKRFIKIN